MAMDHRWSQHTVPGKIASRRRSTLVVEDGLIAAITQGKPSGVDNEIDCSGKTLLPG